MPIDVSATVAALEDISVRLDSHTAYGLGASLVLVQAAARTNVTKRTGELAASITVNGPFPSGPTQWSGTVAPTVIYGRIHELGGWIVPHGHKYLAFQWPGHGDFPILKDGRVLVHEVYQHPKPYLKPAVDEVKGAIGKEMKLEWHGAITGK